MYKLIFYVPSAECERVKQAIFATGAGSLGNYSQCCWQVLGEGHFIPSPNATPHIGNINETQAVAEFRVEVLCTAQNVDQAVQALIESHPYEKPAFEVYQPIEKYFDFYTQ
ncbi:MAG: NGG1p interacting factor NIF3 [Oceanospirillaceae bacterium]|nr:NGG1p interacting factor NIF3 [Oceanospirillaceae bacterium]